MKRYLIKKTDKRAIDTNILVYAYQNTDLRLKNISIELMKNENIQISHFTLIEFFHVLMSKMKKTKEETMKFGIDFLNVIKLTECTKETYDLAYFIMKRYQNSLKDSLIIADAILNNCDILYSRDMQHNQIYEKRTRIINPYKHSP